LIKKKALTGFRDFEENSRSLCFLKGESYYGNFQRIVYGKIRYIETIRTNITKEKIEKLKNNN
jgi:hypothetical protein